MVSIRGATTIDDNTVRSILDGTKDLIRKIEKDNSIEIDRVTSIIFSVTNDLDKVAPARAARELGYTNAGLMCFNEMTVENSLKKCIRLMMFYNSELDQKSVNHVYLGGAKSLRPDIIR